MQQRISRRRFLTTAAAVSTFNIVPRHVLGGSGHTPPSETLNVAGIGIGGIGAANLKHCRGENIVALCDIDHRFAAKTFAAYPNATPYTDFRVMLEKAKDIDAVVIATPDHTHAVISMAAMLLGNLGKRFPGRELQWDNAAMRVTNFDEANDWVRRPYRDGWAL